MSSDDWTLTLRIVNAILALSALPLFAALSTYHGEAIRRAAPRVARAMLWLIAAVAISSAWRAANGPQLVPSVVLNVSLVLLVGALLLDLRNRRA